MLNLSTLVQISSQLLILPFKCKARKHEENDRTQEFIPLQRTVKLPRCVNWRVLLHTAEYVSMGIC